MAKNYTLKEAANIIAEGTKKDEIIDIGRRFPLLAVSLTATIAKAGDTFLDFINYMPEYMTANKVNSLMKAGVYDTSTNADDTTDDTTDEEAEEKPVKKEKKAAKKNEAENDEDGSYESMTAVELFKECKKRGIKKAVPKKPADFYIDLLNKDDKAKAKAEPEDEDWEEEEPEEKPVKKAKEKVEKPAKKTAKKPEPEPEDEDDDEDDWEI